MCFGSVFLQSIAVKFIYVEVFIASLYFDEVKQYFFIELDIALKYDHGYCVNEVLVLSL